MDAFQLTFVLEVIPVARRAARLAFPRGTRERREKIDDVLSYAWQIAKAAQGNPRATPHTIAAYSVKRVKSRRRFTGSVRSIDAVAPKGGKPRGLRVEFELFDAFRLGDNPADIVAVQLDFRRWIRRLKPKARKVCRALLAGFSTAETAKLVGLTPPRVSQYRRELKADWEAFTA
jgi:DNA-directed RNA polymerase specialized sigma24 family protein